MGAGDEGARGCRDECAEFAASGCDGACDGCLKAVIVVVGVGAGFALMRESLLFGSLLPMRSFCMWILWFFWKKIHHPATL